MLDVFQSPYNEEVAIMESFTDSLIEGGSFNPHITRKLQWNFRQRSTQAVFSFNPHITRKLQLILDIYNLLAQLFQSPYNEEVAIYLILLKTLLKLHVSIPI